MLTKNLLKYQNLAKLSTCVNGKRGSHQQTHLLIDNTILCLHTSPSLLPRQLQVRLDTFDVAQKTSLDGFAQMLAVHLYVSSLNWRVS